MPGEIALSVMNPARGDERGGWGCVLGAPGIMGAPGDNGNGAGMILNAQRGSDPARTGRASLECQGLRAPHLPKKAHSRLPGSTWELQKDLGEHLS